MQGEMECCSDISHILFSFRWHVKGHLCMKPPWNQVVCLNMEIQPPVGWYIIITVVGVYEHFAAS